VPPCFVARLVSCTQAFVALRTAGRSTEGSLSCPRLPLALGLEFLPAAFRKPPLAHCGEATYLFALFPFQTGSPRTVVAFPRHSTGDGGYFFSAAYSGTSRIPFSPLSSASFTESPLPPCSGLVAEASHRNSALPSPPYPGVQTPLAI